MKLAFLVIAWVDGFASTCNAPAHHDCTESKYRTITGHCNNKENPSWGAEATPGRRLLPPIYESIRGNKTFPVGYNPGQVYRWAGRATHRTGLPGVRTVSNAIAKVDPLKLNFDNQLTDIVSAYGQLIAHTMIHAPDQGPKGKCVKAPLCVKDNDCFPIELDQNDPFRGRGLNCLTFTRGKSACPDSPSDRSPLNDRSSYIDASIVYGHNAFFANGVRDKQRPQFLKENPTIRDAGGRAYLPYFPTPPVPTACMGKDNRPGTYPCFMPGDPRAVTPALMVQHTMWFRYHNHIVDRLAKLNPHWDAETLFQETRKIITGLLQKIAYYDYLPLIIGKDGADALGRYPGYDRKLDASVSPAFSAANRFGHGMVRSEVFRLNERYQPHRSYPTAQLVDTYLRPWAMTDFGGVDPTLRGMIFKPQKLVAPGAIMIDDVRQDVFNETKPGHFVGHDVASINMQRGRDHGLPLYGAWRGYCYRFMRKYRNTITYSSRINYIKNSKALQEVRRLYKNENFLDLWLAGMLEEHVKGGVIGPTFRCIIMEQFNRVRAGDRHWYESTDENTPEQIQAIQNMDYGNLICQVTGLKKIPPNVFKQTPSVRNMVDCSTKTDIDLTPWAENANAARKCNPNHQSWRDANGKSCFWYQLLHVCSTDGQQDPKWEKLHGSGSKIADAARGGFSGFNCPACGCSN